ncbi:hypothetical protein TW95_gp1246 [Pandoravirus inopinatum]|uniref:Transmembrane protein n=1 Tax=Pandoravirus inopinatum TaxID=1605721 RepID=A0A0B5J7T7_9VIRU|nr:hypothetical protein TW95_gp1246 [Pandoravirus inopinatum]AJF97980.1 hypothetical protein [Pandoravirus inopinatum]
MRGSLRGWRDRRRAAPVFPSRGPSFLQRRRWSAAHGGLAPTPIARVPCLSFFPHCLSATGSRPLPVAIFLCTTLLTPLRTHARPLLLVGKNSPSFVFEKKQRKNEKREPTAHSGAKKGAPTLSLCIRFVFWSCFFGFGFFFFL